MKVVRRVEDGTMNVYFDDMEKPFMTAKDKTFTWGQVGIGTFDDHGNFDDITLRGVRVEKANNLQFSRKRTKAARRSTRRTEWSADD